MSNQNGKTIGDVATNIMEGIAFGAFMAATAAASLVVDGTNIIKDKFNSSVVSYASSSAKEEARLNITTILNDKGIRIPSDAHGTCLMDLVTNGYANATEGNRYKTDKDLPRNEIGWRILYSRKLIQEPLTSKDIRKDTEDFEKSLSDAALDKCSVLNDKIKDPKQTEQFRIHLQNLSLKTNFVNKDEFSYSINHENDYERAIRLALTSTSKDEYPLLEVTFDSLLTGIHYRYPEFDYTDEGNLNKLDTAFKKAAVDGSLSPYEVAPFYQNLRKDFGVKQTAKIVSSVTFTRKAPQL